MTDEGDTPREPATAEAATGQATTAEAMTSRFPCPSWCDQEHTWQEGDDTHWVTHTRRFTRTLGLKVEAWQVVTADGSGVTAQPAVINIETPEGVVWTSEAARHLVHTLRVAIDSAADLVDKLNGKAER